VRYGTIIPNRWNGLQSSHIDCLHSLCAALSCEGGSEVAISVYPACTAACASHNGLGRPSVRRSNPTPELMLTYELWVGPTPNPLKRLVQGHRASVSQDAEAPTDWPGSWLTGKRPAPHPRANQK
jgi:hypothetical protein